MELKFIQNYVKGKTIFRDTTKSFPKKRCLFIIYGFCFLADSTRCRMFQYSSSIRVAYVTSMQ